MRQHQTSNSPARETAAERQLRLERSMEAFAPHLREPIVALSERSQALQDLADSFPALLFALSTKFGTASARKTARGAIEQGKSLRDAADALGLPFWLRKVPAQALLTPFTRVPCEPALVARLQSLVPPQPGVAAQWLDRVLVAYHTGRPELALWVAQTYRAAGPTATSESFLRVLAWAWHATQPETRGGQLLHERWTPNMGLRRAASEAGLWRERVALDLFIGPGITDPWLEDGHARGYDFVALRTSDDFFAEALAMDNCLDRYADRLAAGAARIFSIRRDGVPIADVEIACHERELGMPSVSQLRAARNRRAPMDVWQATFAWLGQQSLRPGVPEQLSLKVGRAEQKRRLERFWSPFLDALPEHARGAFQSALTAIASGRPPTPVFPPAVRSDGLHAS